MPQLPPRPLKGEPIDPDWFPKMWEYLRSLEPHGDLRTVKVTRDRRGTIISAPRVSEIGAASGGRVSSLIAKITADNDDGTYNATAQYNDAGTFANRTSDEYDFSSGAEGVLYELNGRTGIEVGTFVIVEQIEDDDGGIIWYFDHTSGLSEYGVDGAGAWVEITSSTNPYSWKQKDPDASTDTSPSVTGTNNLYEIQDRAGIHVGEIVWARPDGSNYQFVCHSANEDYGPGDIKRTQASGGSLVSGVFDRESQGNNRGTEVNFLTGVFADATGNKLYSYYRTLICDANGHIVAVNGEKDEIVGCATFTCGGSGTPPTSTTGPHAHYPFEEGSGTTVADISGNGYDGTANGGMGWDSSAAVGSYAGDFDGSNDYVDCPSGADPAPGSGDMSCFAWINGTADGHIVCASDGSNIADLDWALRVSGGNVFAYVGRGSSSSPSVTGGAVSSGWHSIGFTISSGTLELWYDNVSQGTVSIGGAVNNNGTNLGIGAFKDANTGTWSGFYTGSIDDVRIYDRALSNAEIASIYNKTI